MIKQERDPRLTTPRSAAVAGIVFALLFAASLTFIRLSIPGDLSSEIDWIAKGRERLSLALILMPFAGIAFLWFIGVIRDRFGELEDRFFSTVFFGSSLLFMGMVFVAMAVAGAMMASFTIDGKEAIHQDVIFFGRALMIQISNVYALRMAGVLMVSLATIWLRTQLMPRWLVGITYLLACALLLVVSLSLWITLLFPAWVLLVSVYVLLQSHREQMPVTVQGEE
ncbi:MAG: hypothetical protein R6X34_14700 [Chloroflexota bacterium]|jgi:hypothetical protein